MKAVYWLIAVLLTLTSVGIIGLFIVYLVSPIDLMPGLPIDDAILGVISVALAKASNDVKKKMKQKRLNG